MDDYQLLKGKCVEVQRSSAPFKTGQIWRILSLNINLDGTDGELELQLLPPNVNDTTCYIDVDLFIHIFAGTRLVSAPDVILRDGAIEVCLNE